MQMNSLRIGVWNANGLILHNRKAEILVLNNKIDILLISETHFTSSSKIQINSSYSHIRLSLRALKSADENVIMVFTSSVFPLILH